MKFTQNYWGQRGMINTIEILTKRGSDNMHDFIPTEYQKISL